MRTTLIALAVLVCSVVTAAAEPAFFTDKPYAEAKAEAAKAEKLLFVKATAEWCGPCKQMDRTTFRDERVVEWLTANAVSVSVDVDKLPRIAQELRVRAMPTTVVFRGDEELARVVGYRDADQLLAWLQAAESGEMPRAAPVAEHDMMARLDRAREMLFNGDDENATAEYLWLWQHMLEHEPAMVGVRVSFMASNMEQLARQSVHARDAFTGLRDETEDRLKNGPRTWEDLHDWLVLNERVLGDRARILAWVDRVKDRPTATATFQRAGHLLEDVLIDEGRWALCGSIIRDPKGSVRQAESMYSMSVSMDGDSRHKAEMLSISKQHYRDDVGRLHAALLAADRDDEAWTVAERAVGFMEGIGTLKALIDNAEAAGVLESRHLDLLDEGNAEHKRLIRRVRTEIDG